MRLPAEHEITFEMSEFRAFFNACIAFLNAAPKVFPVFLVAMCNILSLHTQRQVYVLYLAKKTRSNIIVERLCADGFLSREESALEGSSDASIQGVMLLAELSLDVLRESPFCRCIRMPATSFATCGIDILPDGGTIACPLTVVEKHLSRASARSPRCRGSNGFRGRWNGEIFSLDGVSG